MLRAWVPVAVWLGVIALESTSMASAANTGTWLKMLLSLLPGNLSGPAFQLIHFALRKSGHFIGYGVLGLLFFRALRATVLRSAVRLAGWSVLLTAVVASLDEFHQSFLPSRTGSVRDVLLDTLGAACLLTISLLCLWLHQSFQTLPPPPLAREKEEAVSVS